MTDTAETVTRIITVGGGIVTGTLALLAWASGDREGRTLKVEADRSAASSSVVTAAGGAVYAGMIDQEAYKAVVEGLRAILMRLDAIDVKLARMVELGENQDEREAREQQHRDIKAMFQDELDKLREDMRKGEERRIGRNVSPSA